MTALPTRRLAIFLLRLCSVTALAGVSVAYGQLYPRLQPTAEFEGCGIPCHSQVGALDGDTAVVVNTFTHAVEIHTRGDDDSWSITATLLDPAITPPPPPNEEDPPAPDPYENSTFGSAVALSRDVLLVASSTSLTGDAAVVPKVYVFRRNAEQWLLRQTIELTPPPNSDSYFINELALDGRTALISTVAWQSAGETSSERGAVHVYARNNAGRLRPVATVSPRDALNSNFGAALDLQANTFAVGANLHRDGRGAVYVYRRAARGWKLKQTLTAPRRPAYAEFGSVVAISGRTLAVGAPAPGVPRSTLEGKVYIFGKHADRWQLRQTLTNPLGDAVPEFTTPFSTFGAALDVSGRRLIVAGDFPFNESGTTMAPAFLFERRSGQWTAVAELGRDPPGKVSVSRLNALLLEKTTRGTVPTIYQLPVDSFAEPLSEDETMDEDAIVETR